MTELPVDRAAKILHRSPETIIRRIKQGKLPAHKVTVGGHEEWRIDISDNPSIGRVDIPSWEVVLAEKDHRIEDLQAEISTMKAQLEARDREISALHENAPVLKSCGR